MAEILAIVSLVVLAYIIGHCRGYCQAYVDGINTLNRIVERS